MDTATTPVLKQLKYWIRSGSYRFLSSAEDADGHGHFLWNDHPFYFRPQTGDRDLIHQILLKPAKKREYRFPRQLQPKVILDIGANIGATAVLLAKTYPEARIFAFEPEPSNALLLKKNTEPYPQITALNFGLGREEGSRELILEDDGDNLGGYSFWKYGQQVLARKTVEVRNLEKFLRTQGVSQVDLIKVDTEGAEDEILSSLPEETLGNVQWICGELHGINDFELLKKLDKWFQIGLRKSWWHRLAHFEACRKDIQHPPF